MRYAARDVDLLAAWPKTLRTPPGLNRRAFLIRHAAIGAAAILTGQAWTTGARAQRAATEASAAKLGATLSPDLNVVKQEKGPVLTVLEEFYKVGPGPSSSHTIGPMRITYDFYQRCEKLSAEQLARATGLKVRLFGSLSATGKGHGTERASLAGLVGQEPATVDPAFLDNMAAHPEQTYPVKLGSKEFPLSLADVIYDSPKGDFPHPNTMTCQLVGGNDVLYELEYYSVGGGFIEWKGYTPPTKGQPKYPYATMAQLRQHAESNNMSISDVILANEIAVGGKNEEQINAFLDKIAAAMLATVRSGLAAKNDVLPGPIKLHAKAATVWARAMDEQYESDRAIGLVTACALAASEENARGHLVITAPTGGSAGVMPAIVFGVVEGKRKLAAAQVRRGLLAAAAIGYLCKHNATLSGAEGGCQAEVGVASAMAAAMLADAFGGSPRLVSNAAEFCSRKPSWPDLRSGCWLCAGSVHRTLRVRRREGLDRLYHREQRGRDAAPRRSRHHDQDDGRDGSRHVCQIQGDKRGRTCRQSRPLLTGSLRAHELETSNSKGERIATR